MTIPRNACQLCSREPTVSAIASYRLGAKCIARIRAIAEDAGVPIDEQLVRGQLRKLNKRALAKAERRSA